MHFRWYTDLHELSYYFYSLLTRCGGHGVPCTLIFVINLLWLRFRLSILILGYRFAYLKGRCSPNAGAQVNYRRARAMPAFFCGLLQNAVDRDLMIRLAETLLASAGL